MKSERTRLRETDEAAQWFRDRLDYDSNTGHLLWKDCKHFGEKHKGSIAGFVTTTTIGYRRIMIHGFMDKIYIASRVVWLLCSGDWPSGEIDHVNGDSTVNLFCGLRDVSRRVNHKNMPIRKDNTSGVTGVCWHKGAMKWSSEILVDGKKAYLGLFCDINLAVSARKAAEGLYGFHENHGRSR